MILMEIDRKDPNVNETIAQILSKLYRRDKTGGEFNNFWHRKEPSIDVIVENEDTAILLGAYADNHDPYDSAERSPEEEQRIKALRRDIEAERAYANDRLESLVLCDSPELIVADIAYVGERNGWRINYETGSIMLDSDRFIAAIDLRLKTSGKVGWEPEFRVSLTEGESFGDYDTLSAAPLLTLERNGTRLLLGVLEISPSDASESEEDGCYTDEEGFGINEEEPWGTLTSPTPFKNGNRETGKAQGTIQTCLSTESEPNPRYAFVLRLNETGAPDYYSVYIGNVGYLATLQGLRRVEDPSVFPSKVDEMLKGER